MVLLGDGRNDSPGHCAQYCSYTFIELETKKIVSLTTMDKRVTDRKSGNMEKVCFESSVDQLQQDGVKIKEVVTDAHMGIKALMKSKYTDIHHSHDIWHVAKNLGKKLSKISVKKSNKILQKWNKHIINHFWFVCKTVNSYADFMGLWSGVLHHIVDEHEWAVPNGDNGISYCLHGPLTDVDPEKPYLCRTRHESVLRELSSVLYDKRLLGNVEYYLNFRSTADLEGFHQHILMYCAKRFAYTPPVYRVRNLLAAIDHNMHVDRELVYNKDGTMSLNRVYNKKSGRWSVYPRKTRKEYTYISGIQTTALRSRLDDKKGMYRKSSLESDDPRRLSGHLAPVEPKATSEIFQEQKSRYKWTLDCFSDG